MTLRKKCLLFSWDLTHWTRNELYWAIRSNILARRTPGSKRYCRALALGTNISDTGSKDGVHVPVEEPRVSSTRQSVPDPRPLGPVVVSRILVHAVQGVPVSRLHPFSHASAADRLSQRGLKDEATPGGKDRLVTSTAKRNIGLPQKNNNKTD